MALPSREPSLPRGLASDPAVGPAETVAFQLISDTFSARRQSSVTVDSATGTVAAS